MESAICRNPQARPFISAFFCISFEIVSGLVMFSMFVGAVSLSMTSSIDEINEKQTQMRREKRLKEEKKRLKDRLSGKVKDVSNIIAPEEFERQRKLAEVLSEVWDGADPNSKTKKKGGLLSGDERMEGVNPLGKAYLITVADPVRAFTRSSLFTTVLLSVIIVACILVGFQTDPRIKDDPDVLPILHGIDRAATGVFVVECVLKIVAEGLKPWAYFQEAENVFDFFIVVGSLAFDSGLFILLRLVRLFRVLKLVKSVPELKMHVTALIKGVQSIGYIGTIMFIFFYVFGIVAWMMFKDNDPWHFSNVLHAMLTLFRCATFEDWTDVMCKFLCPQIHTFQATA